MKKMNERTVKELSEMLDAGRTTPEELVEFCIAETEKLQPSLNAYITFCPEQARLQAKAEGEAIRQYGRKSPLHGIPFAVKDLLYVEGVPCTAGAEQMRNFIPDHDTTSVRKLKAAGAIFMGKTNTQEWGCGPTGDRSFFGPARNPHDPTMITGGSSSGSAAAVASGMVPMALGTDAGGSIRIPSALCGIAGFKPSADFLKEDGQLKGSIHLGVSGPMAKTVEDLEIMMGVLAPGFAGEEVNALRGRRFAVPECFLANCLQDGVKKVFDRVIENLIREGAIVEAVDNPWFDDIASFSSAITFPEIAYLHRQRLKEDGDSYPPYIRERIEKGFGYSALEYIDAMEQRRIAMEKWAEFMENRDALILPTTPVTAFPVFSKEVDVCGRTEDGAVQLVRHTRAANVLGCPALSVPAGLTDGLPVGVMLMGARNRDADLLALGHCIEKMLMSVR